MRCLTGRMQGYIGTGAFYKGALMVMIPVIIQQLINNMFNMVDNVMVGSLDLQGLAMSAVTVANKPYVIFFGVFFGLTGAGGLMISQFYGSGDRKTCQGLFSLQLLLGFLNSFLFFAVLFLIPEQVMRIFVTDERTIELGVRYLRVVCFSYIPVAISNTCIFSMRALGQNRTPMLVSLATMGVNAFFNYILIFGPFGLPALGVEGAAWGTLIARLFEMAFYVTLLVRKRMYFNLDLSAAFKLPRKILRSYAFKAIPLIANELLWTVGQNVYFWCYARLDEAALPAITIAEQCYQIAAVMAMGTASAVSVLIGAELGANQLKRAKENCKKLLSLVMVLSVCCTLLCAALAVVLPLAFTVSDELRQAATNIALMTALFAPLNFAYSYCFYCLRAGGDTRNAMLLDSGYMWLVPVPASVLMALLLPGRMGIFGAALIVQILMNLKVLPALLVLKRGRWVRNITIAQED